MYVFHVKPTIMSFFVFIISLRGFVNAYNHNKYEPTGMCHNPWWISKYLYATGLRIAM